MTILRPLLPLLLLIPLIVVAGAVHAAAPLANASPPAAVAAPQRSSAAPIKPTLDSRLARIFTVSAQSCVRTGNRMIC
jgi:hypothetical protein